VVEQQSTRKQIDRLRSREAARLALYLAIGQLNQSASADTHITARADITNPVASQRYWTGAWDAANPQRAPTWLVSGDSTSSTGLTIFNASDGSTVKVPDVTIQSETSKLRIAWWTSDEGIKASVAANESSQSPHHLYAKAHFPTALFGYTQFDDELRELNLDKPSSLQQFQLLLDQLNPRYAGNEALEHAFTYQSQGVLSSSALGFPNDLLTDLSQSPETIGPAMVDYLRAARSHSPTNTTRLKEAIIRPVETHELEDGQIAQTTTPILSNCLLAFTIRSHSPVKDYPNFRLRMRFFTELWNPYSSPLSLADEDNQPLDFELHLRGLPKVTVHRVDSTQLSSPIDLQQLLGAPDAEGKPLIIRLTTDNIAEWRAGQCLNWTGVSTDEDAAQSPYHSVETQSKHWHLSKHTLGGSVGIDTHEPRFPGRLRHSSPTSHELSLQVYAVNRSTNERRLLSQINGLSYLPLSTDQDGYGNTHSGTTFGYHIQLRGPPHSNADPNYYRGRWLYDHDPRNPQLTLNSNWHLDSTPDQQQGSPYIPVKDGITPLLSPTPESINEATASINASVFRRLLDRSAGQQGHADELWQDSPVFELPITEPHNLASLQHLYFHNERPFQIGNSWGRSGRQNTNAWFDRYFFSGSHEAAPKPFPHFKSIGDRDDTSTVPANQLLVHNRFNINSTSIPAWTAVLSGLQLNNWAYRANDTTNKRTTRGASFCRFPFTQSANYTAAESPEYIHSSSGPQAVAPSAFYRRGIRHLKPDQVTKLAEAIVAGLQDRGRPFMTMEAFLSAEQDQSKSLLELAIETALATDGIQYWDPAWQNDCEPGGATLIPIDHFAPGFLTQADILSAIGHFIAPRSDTFRIRTKAVHQNLDSNQQEHSIIEAVVQRTPKRLVWHGADTVERRRKFVIRSIQWVEE